jgi:iron complex outermembrane receptor protein
MDNDESLSRTIAVATMVLCLAVTPLTGFAEDEQQAQEEKNTVGESSLNAAPLPVVRADIEVFGKFTKTPAVTNLGDAVLHGGQAKDAGDVLRSAPAVSSGRMGGHGLDPRIRGLGESSIRILIDGAEIHGGCPNRMDPPSSFAAVEHFDEVVVVRGVQTLRYGTAPGTVLFERLPIRFFDESWWQISANAVAGTNNDGPAVGFSAAVGTSKLSFEAAADRLKMSNYTDGNGEEIASAFDSRNGSIALGWTPDDLTSVRLSYELNRTKDALYAGAGMDSPESDTDAVRLRFRRNAGSGVVGEIRGDLYWSDVSHLMDNYSLRDWTAPMAMKAPSTSRSTGGRLWIDLNPMESFELSAGIDLAHNDREAHRFAGPNPDNVSMLQSLLWPEVDLEQNGLFVEGDFGIGLAGALRFGIRGDSFSASAGAADVKPAGMNPTPRQLWESYYGAVDDNWERTIVGGFVRYQHRLPRPKVGFFAGFSRTARAADTTQRFMAGNSSMAPKRWVGDPALDVEVHNQIDLGFEFFSSISEFEVTMFFDNVDDAILRDRAHGQPGILKEDNATIYRNISARRAGLEIVGQWRIGSALNVGGDAAYVYAQNTTDDRPIAQTPPFEGRVFAFWTGGRFGVSSVVRWSATQARVDDDPVTGSGLDVGQTPGWAILNLSGQADLGLGFQVLTGVDNALDRAYAYHLNRDNFFDPGPVQINEPGRVFWLRLRWSGGG